MLTFYKRQVCVKCFLITKNLPCFKFLNPDVVCFRSFYLSQCLLATFSSFLMLVQRYWLKKLLIYTHYACWCCVLFCDPLLVCGMWIVMTVLLHKTPNYTFRTIIGIVVYDIHTYTFSAILNIYTLSHLDEQTALCNARDPWSIWVCCLGVNGT